MKAGRIIKISLVAILVLGLVAYLVYAMLFLSAPDEEELCVDMELTIKNEDGPAFVDKGLIEELLKNARIYPKGMLMKDIDPEQIERAVCANEFIAEAECYKASNGRVCINATQRVPVIFVIPDGRDGYFVDAKGTIIPNRNCAIDLVVASGDIDEKYARTQLAEFGKYLLTDDFWNNQIEQIHVVRTARGKRVVELVPRVGDQIISLGAIDDYVRKLHKMRTFYERASSTVGWKKYSKISLEYDNQIICTKRK